MPVKVRALLYILLLCTVIDASALDEKTIDLDEVVVESAKRPVLHMLAYVREYSTLSTYDDTVFLFREKYVDFMIPPEGWKRRRGWTRPRLLASKSYYRFTDSDGTDSVSDFFPEHFSWSDWVEIYSKMPIPAALRGCDTGNDTVAGKYTPATIWQRDSDHMTVDIDVLADTSCRVWVPAISGFLDGDLDFRRLKLHYTLDNVDGDEITARDISVMAFEIESNGRGRNLKRLLNTGGGETYVETRGEVYIFDKEYISAKDAGLWERKISRAGDIDILPPPEAPELSASTLALVGRVDGIDRDAVRIGREADRRLASFNPRGYKLSIVEAVKSLINKVKKIGK